MDIIFFGTPELSSYVLSELKSSGLNIKAVVTQPDRKSGRGQTLTPPHVKETALKLGLKVIQSETFDKKLFHELSSLGNVDVCVVVAYGCYIPTYFIDHMSNRVLNIHFSLLPKYRGAAPVARAIMNGDSTCGVSIMEITKEMDAGNVLVQSEINISSEENTQTVSWRLVKVGTRLLLDNIDDYVNGDVKSRPQSDMGIPVTYAAKIKPEEKYIDWNKDAISISNQIKGLYPWPVAESSVNGLIIKFIKAKAIQENVKQGFEAGFVVGVDKKKGYFTVSTGEGLLLVEKVKPSGKKELSVSDFLNGYELKQGMRFS